MEITSDPRDIFEEMERNFSSIEQFDNLARSSSFYYQKFGSLNILKLFIPNGKKTPDGYSYLNNWNPEKADQAANDVIRVLTGQRISNAYFKENKDDGIYLAFKTETPVFLTMTRYLSKSSYLIDKGRKNGVNITADEWLKDFPYEFHAAWFNRPAVTDEINVWLREPGNELFAQALFDGQQNWLERDKYPKIEAWNPTGEFTTIFEWEYKDTPDEIEARLKEFRTKHN